MIILVQKLVLNIVIESKCIKMMFSCKIIQQPTLNKTEIKEISHKYSVIITKYIRIRNC